MHIGLRYVLLPLVPTVLFISSVKGQETLHLTLADAISLSSGSSLDKKRANNIVKSAYWNYRAYKAGFLPKLSLEGNLPDYYRIINMITLPDGKYDFVTQNVASSNMRVNLVQQIGLTGGAISVSSSVQRIDNFGKLSNTAYTSVPLTLSYFQHNLFYNEYKWQNRIEPLKFQEAQREYVENIEAIACATVDKYFNLLRATLQLKLDKQNLQNIDTLIKITQARFDIGTVELNDVLQAKVSHLNARKSLAAAQLALKDAQQQFILYLNLSRNTNLQPQLPDTLAFFDIDPQMAISKAVLNRQYTVEHKRRRLEAEQAITRVKSETGPAISLNANVGLTQTGNSLGKSYNDLLRNQSVSVGFNIPLLDWGVNRSNRKRAEANLELELNNIRQEQLAIEQDIYYKVIQWNMQREQMSISKDANELAQQRYNISKEKYAAGGLSFTDFNNAQQEKDQAAFDYLNGLYNYWSLYFTLRKITLYDFKMQRDIKI